MAVLLLLLLPFLAGAWSGEPRGEEEKEWRSFEERQEEVPDRRLQSAIVPPECLDVSGWTDWYGSSCLWYRDFGKCTREGGEGPEWKFRYTSIESFGFGGYSSLTACCACGACPNCRGCIRPLPLQSPRDFAEFATFNCSHVVGDLFVWPQSHADLEMLAGLESVSGQLALMHGSENVTSLRGLSSLRSVGQLRVRYMKGLRSLEGLRNLSIVEGRIFVGYNDNLASLDGLENVQRLNGSLWVQNCPRLASIAGVSGLRTLGEKRSMSLRLQDLPILGSIASLTRVAGPVGSITIKSLDLLESLDGLEGVTSLSMDTYGKSIELDGLRNLRSISGLRGLRGRVPGTVDIEHTPALQSTAGLEGVTSLKSLHIAHAAIETLDGLDSLRSIEGGRLRLRALVRLRSIAALRRNLTGSVGGLFLEDLPLLESLDGLNGITSVGQLSGVSLEVKQCNVLADLSGLSSLRGPIPGDMKIESCPSLRSLQGLEGVTSLGGALEIYNCPELECLSALGGLSGSMSGRIRLASLPSLRSMHGLEGLNSTGHSQACACGGCTELLSSTITVDGCASLQSISALGSMHGGIGTISISSSDALLSLQGIWGILARRLVVQPGPQLCITEPERQALEALPAGACGGAAAAAAGIVGYGRAEQAVLASECIPCDPPCGSLANGHPIECDYRIGECRCPLGTRGPGCLQAVPRVSVVPGQTFDCTYRKARVANGTAVCDLRILLRKLGRRSAPAHLALYSQDGRSAHPGTTALEGSRYRSLTVDRVTWHNHTHGELLAHVALFRLEKYHPGKQLLYAYVGYEQGATPDALLEGTVLNGALTSSAPRIYPWCLGLGAGCRLTSPETVLVRFSQDPGYIRFARTAGHVLESSLVWVVLMRRVGGDEGAIGADVVPDAASTAILDVDYTLANSAVRWIDGERQDQVVLVRPVDNSVWEPDKSIVLRIGEVTHRAVRGRSNQVCNITVSDDGDGGVLRFLPPGSVREDAGDVGQCLVSVERVHGNSGRTSVQVLLEPLAQKCGAPSDLTATPDGPSVAPGVADFSFAQGAPLSWEDGESGAKCVFNGTRAAKLTVYPDWSIEDNELLCLQLAEVEGAASLEPSEVHALVTIQDGGGEKGAYMECDRGTCSCAPGWYANDTAHSDGCRSCEPGHFCRGGSRHEPCRPGSYGATAGATACSLCRRGAFQERAGASFCVDCPVSSFGNETGASACSQCDDLWGVGVRGFTTVRTSATSPSDCACLAGLFLPCPGARCLAGEAPPEGGCRSCPKGFTCPGGLEPLTALPLQQGGRALSQLHDPSVAKVHVGPLLKPGCFASLSEPYCSIKCGSTESEQICPGNRQPGVCGQPHREDAWACGACESGFHNYNGECKPCGERSAFATLMLSVGIFVAVVAAIALAYLVNTQQSKQRHAVVVLSATASLGLFAMQTLGVFGQFSLQWIDPAATVLKVLESLFSASQLQLMQLDCHLRGKSDVVNFLFRLGMMPLAMLLALVGVLAKNFRKTFADVRIEATQTIGTLNVIFFIVMITSTLQPFVVFSHHCEGQTSLVGYPNVFVGSEEYWPMLASGVVTALLLPFPFLALCCWAIWQVPTRVGHGDTSFLRSFRFLFGRFRYEAYFYSLVQLVRNTALSLVPVVTRDSAAGQVLMSVFAVMVPMILQIKLEPWRIEQLNHLETGCLAVILYILCLGALLADTPENSTGVTVVTAAMCLALLLTVLAYVAWGVMRAIRPRVRFAFFICHSKGDAGTRARALQLGLVQESSRLPNWTFIDADHLFNLDTLFETVRCNVRNLVVLLTKSTLSRPWCAGEIATAMHNSVNVIVVRCADFKAPQDVAVELPNMFDYPDSGLAQYEILHKDVLVAYESLLKMEFIEAPRRLGKEEMQVLTARIYGRAKSVNKSGRLSAEVRRSVARPTGKIAILTEASDAEGMAGAVILFHLLLPNLEESCLLQVKSGMSPIDSEELTNYLDLPSSFDHACHTAVILLSRASLTSLESLRIIERIMHRFDGGCGDLNVISVTLPGFQFPDNEYYDVQLPALLEGMEDEVEGHVEQLRQFFKLISVSFNTHGSKSIIQAQAGEVLRRVLCGTMSQSQSEREGTAGGHVLSRRAGGRMNLEASSGLASSCLPAGDKDDGDDDDWASWERLDMGSEERHAVPLPRLPLDGHRAVVGERPVRPLSL